VRTRRFTASAKAAITGKLAVCCGQAGNLAINVCSITAVTGPGPRHRRTSSRRKSKLAISGDPSRNCSASSRYVGLVGDHLPDTAVLDTAICGHPAGRTGDRFR
jgi:hypothetical protein